MAKAKQLPSGNWNILVFSHKDQDGKRHYESFTASTKKEVEFQAAEFALKKQRKKRPVDLTVGEAIDKYIEVKDGVLSPTTISGYKKIRRNNIQGLMKYDLKNLTQEIIQREINKEAKKISERTNKPLSSKSIANIHGLVSSAVTFFMPDFIIRTTLPAKEKKIIELPNVEDVINAIKGTSVELPCMLAIWLSYSMSEVRGIRISSIEDGYITIKEVIVDVDGKPVSKTKTKAYERTRKSKVPDYIMSLIENQETYKNCKLKKVDGYLITMDGKGIYNRFHTILKNAGVSSMRFHDLRHLNASVMLKLGIPDKYAMERGGWKTAHTLKKVYQHTLSDERQAVDKKIDDYFKNLVDPAE